MSQSMKALNAMMTEGITLTEAARRFGISKQSISKTKHHPPKKHSVLSEIESLKSRLDDMTNQRDELLVAINNYLPESDHHSDDGVKYYSELIEAIAKIKEAEK